LGEVITDKDDSTFFSHTHKGFQGPWIIICIDMKKEKYSWHMAQGNVEI